MAVLGGTDGTKRNFIPRLSTLRLTTAVMQLFGIPECCCLKSEDTKNKQTKKKTIKGTEIGENSDYCQKKLEYNFFWSMV